MNAIAAALTTATVLGGAGAVAGCGLPYRVRVPAVGVLTAGGGGGGWHGGGGRAGR
ncbi:hypothetical protein CQR58_001995 [Streptomyces acidiscabies]|uniref:hypothetical protein n=1 Tax=Streptomyces acidiscabies TaxID=42234 RepID=UPI0034C6C94B